MFPINVVNSPTAKRIKVIISCDHCGHQSLEPLSRFHGRYYASCRECLTPFDLKAKENRVVIEKLVKLCATTDAALKSGH